MKLFDFYSFLKKNLSFENTYYLNRIRIGARHFIFVQNEIICNLNIDINNKYFFVHGSFVVELAWLKNFKGNR